MFDPADVHIQSTPESHGSNVNPRSGDSRGRGVSPNRALRITDGLASEPRGRTRVERVPERIEISTPPALRSHSSGGSGDARTKVKEVFDLHIQEIFERGEASSSVVNTLNAFANQIRLLNGQVSSMRREWHDESQQMKDRVSRLATEVETQADADQMRLIVQQFAGEIVPDSRAIVRHAIDEQSEIIDQRINSLSNEVRDCVRNVESGMGQLRQVIQDKHHAIFKSQAAFEGQTNTEIEKFEKQLFSVEKAVRLPPSSHAPAASGPDRATSSGTDVSFRDLTARVDRLQGESDRHAEWATRAIDELQDEHRTIEMLESRGGRGYHIVDRPRDPDAPQDWREAIEEINRKVPDLTRRVYRQGRDHDTVVENVEAANARIATFNESAQRLQQALRAIRTQLGNIPSSTEQTQAVVRRELVFYRNMLDSTMRRLGVVENNIRALNEMNTRVMGQLADLEGHVDDAADMIQVVQQNPRGPQGRPNVGYNAFAGQGHKIRSPTPTRGDRNAQNSVPSAGLMLTLMQTGALSLPLGRGRIAGAEGLRRCKTGHTLRRGAQGVIRKRVSGLMFQFPRTGMKVGTGARGLPTAEHDRVAC